MVSYHLYHTYEYRTLSTVNATVVLPVIRSYANPYKPVMPRTTIQASLLMEIWKAAEGVSVGALVGAPEGDAVGFPSTVGAAVGDTVGASNTVGETVGDVVGSGNAKA